MEHQINDEIRDKEVRLINSDGEQLGIVPSSRRRILRSRRAWIWLRSPRRPSRLSAKSWTMANSVSSRQSAKRKRVKISASWRSKRIRLTPNIDIGDLNTKVKNACRFLKDGDKVKVSVASAAVRLRMRRFGQDLLHRFAELCAECSTVEKQPKLEGRQMLMFLTPLKDK